MPLPRLVSVLVLAASTLAIPAHAGPPKPQSVPSFARENRAIPDSPVGAKFRWLIGVLNGEPAGEPADNFTPEFLKEVPPKKITKMLLDITEGQESGRGGGFGIVRINPGSAPTGLVALIAANASGNEARVELGVDPKSGKIDFLSVTPSGGGGGGDGPSPPDPLDSLKKLSGRVSLYAVLLPPADQSELEPAKVLEYQPAITCAIGSTFKLWILGALAEGVSKGDIKWDEPLAIKNSLKSLASGDMQLQAEGATFPISTFAEKMFSISDNTAADHLLDRVGRANAEAFMASCVAQPRLNYPLLSTREMFTLKIPGDPNLPLRWNVASERNRRKMVAEGGAVAKAEPNTLALSLWTKPVQVENIEWFASTMDLCKTVHQLHKLEAKPGMDQLTRIWTINPGIDLDKNIWHRVAFKGGSEPGVLNFTWMLERADGRTFALSMSWNQTDPNNNTQIDHTRFAEEARKAITHLEQVGTERGQE